MWDLALMLKGRCEGMCKRIDSIDEGMSKMNAITQ